MLALSAVLVAAGCDHDSYDGSPLAVHDGTWNGDDAAVEGRLVEEHGCVVLLVEYPEQDGSRLLPIFAEDGLRWNVLSQIVSVKGEDYKLGDRVRFGGSAWGPDLPSGTKWVNAPSSECRYAAFWGVAD